MEERSSSKRRILDSEASEWHKKREKSGNEDDLNRYTIGWVCALVKEQTAAMAMLDEILEVEIRKAPGDTNTYTLGSIGRHRIVIACLPEGQLGVVKASKVATSMTSTFCNIKFVLMVGIGGGVPSGQTDVRLGDVVVGTPTGRHPAVVQWDFGKTKDGKFERTGSLNNPPALLLTALARMRSYHDMRGSKIQNNLDSMFRKWPLLKYKYEKSDRLKDILFAANYNHLDHSPDSGSTLALLNTHETDCLYCDNAKAERREVREPTVHYGLIASGNQVIKDATYRDEINQNLDGNVLCIEMESAGLMDDFPCLVIRGICDYADSHKNKAWQEHAAAIAAALTKELLEHVQPVDVESECTIVEFQENLENICSTTLATKNAVMKLGVHAKRNEDEKILEWLTPVEYGIQQSDFLRRRQPETGMWFLKSDDYLNWRDLKTKYGHNTLFCPGIPGAGKTILMSSVIDDINTNFSSMEGVGIAYLYCSFHRRQHEDQSPSSFLSSLIKQAVRGLAYVPDSLAKLHKKHALGRTIPSVQELSNVLFSISNSLSTFFILIDALDECQPNSRSALLSVLFALPSKTSAIVKLFATSRNVPEIAQKFDHAQKREIRATSEDIHRYIKHQLPGILEDKSGAQDLEEMILVEISNLVDGMFLLAQLYVESLKDTTSVGEILSSLENFRSIYKNDCGRKLELSHVYDQAYKEAMQRIFGQPPKHRDLGIRIISWIAHSWRPLRAIELQHALAIEKNCTKVDEKNFRDIKIMVSVCAGLVTVDNESGIIRLVHHTTQEFFQREGETYFPRFHTVMSSVCATYLRIAFESCNGREEHRLWSQRLSFRLLYYAVNGWGYHAAQGPSLSPEVKRLLLRGEIMRSISSFMDQPKYPSGLRYPGRPHLSGDLPTSGMGWAAYYGIDGAIDVFREMNSDINPVDSSGTTPLFHAVAQRKATFARRLFQLGAKLPYLVLNNLLHDMIHEGNVEIAEILLENHGWEGPLILLDAIRYRRLEIVRLLMQKSTDASGIQGPQKKTALFNAIKSGQYAMAKFLLENGADVEVPGGLLQTALFECDEDLAMLLINRGIDIEARDCSGKTALVNECCLIQPRVGKVQLLIRRGADVNALDWRQKNALGYACERSSRRERPSKELIKILIDAGSRLPGDEIAAENVVNVLMSPSRLFGEEGWSSGEAEHLMLRLQRNVGHGHTFTGLLFPISS